VLLPRTVLIVDDSPTIRSFAKIFLKQLQLEVVEAEDGAQALALVRENLPLLAIVDVNMPGMDGLTFTRELRADPRPELASLPVVLLTGDRSEQLRQQGVEAGASEFLGKPIRGADLQALVRKLLGPAP
jgi:two-component system chemotaxis response regulator CheY